MLRAVVKIARGKKKEAYVMLSLLMRPLVLRFASIRSKVARRHGSGAAGQGD